MKPRALIVGGSVGGLFAANLLRRAGWDVQVFERAAGSLGDRGTGIGTRDELFDVMRRAGLQVDPSLGVAVRGRIGLARDGQVLESLPVPAVTSGWSRVWRPLKDALPAELYRGAAALVSFEQADGRVAARFADGTQAHGDLLIGADGLHSTVRSILAPELKPQYVGYVAWRGVVDEHEVETMPGDLIFEHMVFGFPERGLFLSLPMPGSEVRDGVTKRRAHFVWFQPASDAELAGLCTDASGKQHGLAIPPPLIRPELIADLKARADAGLPPQLAALVHATRQIILQPIFELESSRLTFGRVALLGDAAFVARPHVATGVMKAALDAQSLSDALASGNVDDALRRYDQERRTFGRWLVARGRHIGETIGATAMAPLERISTLMREYGAAGVVNATRITARAAQ
jgi:2-polyprenyl-6-methoxyphenol hydroxylase-like FAD-dependent oxidoreductase